MDVSAALPRFDELPFVEGLPLRHAWDVFGRSDNLGTLNLLDGTAVCRGLGAARTGERIPLTMPLTRPDPPLFGRQRVEQTVINLDRNIWDDRLDCLFTQASTQWDGFRHVRCREHGFWTGVTADPPDMEEGRLGIEHFAAGIIGRGVLLDVYNRLAAAGRGYEPFGGVALSAGDLRETAEAEGVEILPGDVLCVRVGWQHGYARLTAEEKEALGAPDAALRYTGLSGSEAMAELLWNWHVAALACDNPSVEVVPGDPAVGSLHRRLLPLLGVVLGELFDFETLSRRCAEEGRWTFAFIGIPIHMPGGLGSPANSVAVL